jgi:hypothetical protein
VTSASWIHRFEDEGKRRFARWSSQAFAQLVQTAQKLATELKRRRWPAADAEGLLQSFMQISVEAVGLGYFYVEPSAEPQSFATWLFRVYLPAALSRQPTARQASEELARIFNLAEALDHAQPMLARMLWIRRDQLLQGSLVDSLRSLDSLFSDVGLRPLGEDVNAVALARYSVATVDRFALPARARFLAPRILEVGLKDSPATLILAIDDELVSLGSGGEPSDPWPPEAPDAWRWPEVSSRIGRDSLRASVRNEFFAVALPELSQHLWVARQA